MRSHILFCLPNGGGQVVLRFVFKHNDGPFHFVLSVNMEHDTLVLLYLIALASSN